METIETVPNLLSSDNECKIWNQEKNIISEFRKFLNDVKNHMGKCKYRRALNEIELKEDLYILLENNWKIKELKCKAMLKILEKKFYRSESPKNLKTKSIENWIRKIDVVLDNWLQNLIFIEENQEEIEVYLCLMIEELNFLAIYKRSENLIVESITYLTKAEAIIKSFWNFSRNPKFLNISQSIFLFISNLLIADNDFEESIKYQKSIFKFAFKEFFLRIDIEEGLFLKSLKKTNQHNFNKLFINIVLSLYQNGVAEENLGRLLNAIESYKEAVWFSGSFIKYTYPEISQLLDDIEKRATSYHFLIEMKLKDKIDEHNLELEKTEKVSPIKQDLFSKNKEKNQKQKEAEVVEFINSLNFQDFEFADDENKSIQVKNILSTLTLLNNFSSDQFKDILKDNLDVKNISNIDKFTIEKIQKRLNQIRAEINYKKIEAEKKKEKKTNRFLNSQILKDTLLNHTYNFSDKDFLNKLSYDAKNKNNFSSSNLLSNLNLEDKFYSKINLNDNNPEKNITNLLGKCANILNSNKKFDNNQMNIQSIISSHSRKKTNKINSFSFKNSEEVEKFLNEKSNNSLIKMIENSKLEKTEKSKGKSFNVFKQTYTMKKHNPVIKYEHSDYILSKNFQNKFKNIDELTRKETEFQKKILKLKKFEKLPIEIENVNNKNQINKTVENFFNRVISLNKNSFMINSKDKKKKSDNFKDSKKFQIERMKQRLEVSLIKSLDSKVYKEWNAFVKKTEKSEQKILRDEFINKNRESFITPFSRVDIIEKVNHNQIKIIDKDIDMIDKEEEIFRRMIRPKSTLNNDNFHLKNSTMRSSVHFHNHSLSRNIDSFIKLSKNINNNLTNDSKFESMIKK